jgi:hypothetical protein
VVDESKNQIVHRTSPSKSTPELLDLVATKTEIESTQIQGIMKQAHPAVNRKVTICCLARGTRPGPTRGRSNRAERRAAVGESGPDASGTNAGNRKPHRVKAQIASGEEPRSDR